MQENYYPIKNWAKDDQPREKLLMKGPVALSNAELIAILLQNGIREKSALDLAREVMKLGDDNLDQLGRLTIKDLTSIRGVGTAKAIMLVATLELGRRRQATQSLSRKSIQSSADVAGFLRHLLKDHSHEVFAVLFLNRANRVNHFEIISQGGITGTVADPRIIFKKALQEEAVSIILCHNHPSGNLKPSRADQDMTNKIKEASQFLDIKLLDHIIVSNEGYYSFADEGDL